MSYNTAEIQEAMEAAKVAVPRTLSLLRDVYGLTNGDVALLMGESLDWVQTRLSGRAKRLSYSDVQGFCLLFGIEPHVLNWDSADVLRYVADHPSELGKLRIGWDVEHAGSDLTPAFALS